jgi:hypothetical protein
MFKRVVYQPMLLIIIIIAKNLTNVKCGHFKMSKVSHVTMIFTLGEIARLI